MMKKSNFVAMILGTIGGILFALGMCMAMIPEWNAFRPGVVMGVAGAVVLLIMVLVWRKMEHKVFFVKYFSLKKASEFPFFSKGFSLPSAGIMHPCA